MGFVMRSTRAKAAKGEEAFSLWGAELALPPGRFSQMHLVKDAMHNWSEEQPGCAKKHDAGVKGVETRKDLS